MKVIYSKFQKNLDSKFNSKGKVKNFQITFFSDQNLKVAVGVS